jgi:hypothetical protein
MKRETQKNTKKESITNEMTKKKEYYGEQAAKDSPLDAGKRYLAYLCFEYISFVLSLVGFLLDRVIGIFNVKSGTE